jgi:hypothetical protein
MSGISANLSPFRAFFNFGKDPKIAWVYVR